MKEMKFIAAMKDFFGYHEGKDLKDFAAELKDLTDQDKDFFKTGLEQNGYKILS